MKVNRASVRVVLLSDASFDNAVEIASQLGYVILLADREKYEILSIMVLQDAKVSCDQ